MLTERQQAIYDFIVRFRGQHGCSPSIPEIQREFHIKSPNGVAGHLRALETKGVIQRGQRGSRQINISDLPAGIPLYGQIPAGSPDTLATITPERHLLLDRAALGFEPHEQCFALRVRGDSMLHAGILPGDVVIVDQQHPRRPNQIVAALIDGETTLKRLLHINGRWFLRAENPAYRDLYPETDLTVQGVVRAIVRTLE